MPPYIDPKWHPWFLNTVWWQDLKIQIPYFFSVHQGGWKDHCWTSCDPMRREAWCMLAIATVRSPAFTGVCLMKSKTCICFWPFAKFLWNSQLHSLKNATNCQILDIDCNIICSQHSEHKHKTFQTFCQECSTSFCSNTWTETSDRFVSPLTYLIRPHTFTGLS